MPCFMPVQNTVGRLDVSVVVNIPRDIKVGLMYITNDRQLFGFWTDDIT